MREDKNQKKYNSAMTILITVFITFLITSALVSNYYLSGKCNNVVVLNSNLGSFFNLFKSDSNKSDDSKKVISLNSIQAIIDKYYLGEQDAQKMNEQAIKGYVSGLGDPYSEYITAEEMEEYKAQILGNYVGIGIYMIENEEHNLIQVLAPIKESPAYKAGILPGDLIKKIDGIEYTAEDMTAAANNIKGEEGTKVKLTIIRNGEEKQFELTRKTVLTNPINEEVLENNIGYLELPSFDQDCAIEFKKKFENLQKQGIKRLIIDLRNNTGGLVSEALDIAEYIVEKGDKLLITVNKHGKEEISRSGEKPIINMPIVLLVNENTASASEILAGALKDLNKATIVGTKTYGKGVIQQILTLTDGSGIKLTIEEYFTPNKNKINKLGIEPHEVVELPETVKNPLLVERKDDTQLKRAIEILKNK